MDWKVGPVKMCNNLHWEAIANDSFPRNLNDVGGRGLRPAVDAGFTTAALKSDKPWVKS